MLLFVTIFVLCFRQLGRVFLLLNRAPFNIQFMMWSLGAVLTAHVVSFMGISYFDQTIVPLFLLLAMISATTNWGILKIFDE